LARAEQLDPRQPRWPYLQAVALLKTDPEAALPKLQRTVQLSGDNPNTPRLEWAELLLNQGRVPEAAEQFRRVLQQDPDNVRAYLGLGRLAFEREALADTLTYAQRCVVDAHTRKAARNLLAQTYERLGNKSAAEQELRQAAQLPNDAAWPNPYSDEAA